MSAFIANYRKDNVTEIAGALKEASHVRARMGNKIFI
jgi:hypothetical protein